MTNKATMVRRLVLGVLTIVLLSSFLAFSSLPKAMAESNLEGGQGVNSLAMGQAWVTSYNSAGGFNDIAYLAFGNGYGYQTDLSPYIGAIVNTESNSYVINWRPNIIGDSMYVCGIRVAYRLPDGAGGFAPLFSYFHISGPALFPRSSGVNWSTDWTGGCIYLKSGPSSIIFNKNLNLPDGSKIEYLRVYYFREAQVYLPMIKR